MRTIVCYVILFSVIFTSCASSESIIQQYAAETLQTVPTFTPRATYTPLPTYTSYPTYPPNPTHTPHIVYVTPSVSPTPVLTSTNTATAGPPPSAIGREIACGDAFTIKITQKPYGASKAGFTKATAAFAIFRMILTNKTSRTVSLRSNSFELHGTLDGSNLYYEPDFSASTWLGADWLGKTYMDEIPTGLSFETIVAFDVKPKGNDWILVFVPKDDYSGDSLCQIDIPVNIYMSSELTQ